MIPWRDMLDKFDVHPKVSLWITMACLFIVLTNNHLYLAGLQEREKALREDEARVELKEAGIEKKERVMRLWELELRDREKEVSKMLAEIRVRNARTKGD